MSVREEIEVKVPARGPRRRARAASTSAGATLHVRAARRDERPLRRRRAQALAEAGATVRLRRAAGRDDPDVQGSGPLPGRRQDREEREVEVSDAGEAEAILAGLGLETALSLRKAARGVGLRAAASSRSTRRPSGRSSRSRAIRSAIRKLIVAARARLRARRFRTPTPSCTCGGARRTRLCRPTWSGRTVNRERCDRAEQLDSGRFVPIESDPPVRGQGNALSAGDGGDPQAAPTFSQRPPRDRTSAAASRGRRREVAVNLHHLGDQVERQLREQRAGPAAARVFPRAGDPRHRRRAAQRRRIPRGRRLSRRQLRRRDRARLRGARRRATGDSGRAATLLVDGKSGARAVHAASGRRGSNHGLRRPRPTAPALHRRLRARAPAARRASPPARRPWSRTSGSRCSTRGGKRSASSCTRARTPISAARAISCARRSKRSSAEEPFRREAGSFDDRQRVLFREAPSGFDASASVLGRVSVGAGARILRLHRLGRRRGGRRRAPDGLRRGWRPRSGRRPPRESPSLGRRRRRRRRLPAVRARSGMIMESTLSLPAGSRGCAPSPSRRRRAGRPCRRAHPRGRPIPACSRPSAKTNRCRNC